ncbi:hypothetical protein L596_017042 [Steinernema carpocapsae]|uniref:Uncharacterized protein n=1 Tax=Steinernema carpocapsae TaxID=34508 RepID=A0A4U5N0M5_STECR|nr:hypothetical protein L596_017042 [Steinernema carpocapsae]
MLAIWTELSNAFDGSANEVDVVSDAESLLRCVSKELMNDYESRISRARAGWAIGGLSGSGVDHGRGDSGERSNYSIKASV